MKYFFRSLRYLKPYRGRLAVSIVCVIMVAALWSGGLGMMVPVMKVVFDPEGLHGWAWRSMAQDKLELTLLRRVVPAGLRVEGESLSVVREVVDVEADSPAGQADVAKTQWLLGLADGQDHLRMRGDELARHLAALPAGQDATLRIYDQSAEQVRDVPLTLGAAGLGPRILGRIARVLPEPAGDLGRLPIVMWLLGIGIGVTALRNLFRFFQEYIVQSTVWLAVMDLRCENYSIALRLPVTFYAQQGTTDTMSRFVEDTMEIGRGQISLFGKTIAEPAKALGSAVMAFTLSWELTLLATIARPPTFLLIRLFGRIMRRSTRRALESWAEILALLDETLRGIRVVKTYTMEGTERRRFLRANRQLHKQQRRIARIDAMSAPTVETLSVTAAMLAAGFGAYYVLSGRVEAAYFFGWLACLAGMYDAVRKLAKVYARFHRADAAAARVFELADREQEKRLPGATSLPRHSESLEFRNVHFRYPSAAEDALRDVTLKIDAGQTVAIVGPNGCGKTTLVSLVPRLLDPSAGEVRIDGHDVSQHSLRSLRLQIGFVTQDSVLFNATIAENIAYGLRLPRHQQVLEAARRAFVHEFVEDLPDGYDTMVGQQGATLSGGQKQRITIARAILRDPAILIFDEATSQIDADSEQRIHQAMADFVTGRTTLLIAHRFTTIQSAQRIVVMDEGRIIDDGPHPELLERCGLYKQLYYTQLGAGEETGGRQRTTDA